MARQVGTLVLISTLLIAGASVCPGTSMACARQLQADHGCCHDAALRSHTCCCAETPQPLRSIGSLNTDTPERLSKRLAFASVNFLPPAAAMPVASGVRLIAERGLAPPGTPAAQHTVLLL